MAFFQGKRLIVVFLLTAFCLIPIHAANVSVMVVETGLKEHPANDLVNIWETGMMDILFDAGYIVSNARSILIPRTTEEDLPEEIKSSFQEADAGGADYFVVVFLQYSEGVDLKMAKPEQITLKLFNMQNFRVIFNEKMEKPNNSTSRDEYANAQKAAKIVMPYLGGKAGKV